MIISIPDVPPQVVNRVNAEVKHTIKTRQRQRIVVIRFGYLAYELTIVLDGAIDVTLIDRENDGEIICYAE